jgi:hypothetical protein
MIGRLSAALRHPAAVADTLTIALGCWAIYAASAVYLGWTFDRLASSAWMALVAFAAAWTMLLRHGGDGPAPGPQRLDGRARTGPVALATLSVAGLFCVLWWLRLTPYGLFGIAALCHLGVVSWLNRDLVMTGGSAIRADVGKPDLAVLLAVAVAALLVTLTASRPDLDDAYYVNAIVTALDHPDWPLLMWDGMHGEQGVPISQVIHRPQTLELLAALVARTRAMSADTVYYVLFPAVFSLLFPVAQWLLCRQVDARHAALSVILVFVVTLAWGDGHRAYGNFGFVRLFQGKGSFVTVLVPLITYYGVTFGRAPHWRPFVLLSLAQCAAVSLTSSALVMAPICMGLALLGGSPLSRAGLKRIATGALSAVPVLITIVLVRMDLAEQGPLIVRGPLLDVAVVWGESWRAPLALIGVVALPVAACRVGLPSTSWLCRYVFAGFLVIVSGIAGRVFAPLAAELFSWRMAWAFPAPTLVASTLALGLAYGWTGPMARPAGRWCRRIAAGSLLSLFVLVGGHTLSLHNGVHASFAKPKHPEAELLAARVAAESTPPGGLVLAPMPVATVITRLHHHPRIVAVRDLYLANLSRHWGEEESRDRLRLMVAIGGALRTRSEIRWVLNEIKVRDITTIVCRPWISVRLRLARRLRTKGYSRRRAGAYLVWYRAQ